MTRTLLITNDFPPRLGGIQTFVYELAVRQPAASLVVLTSMHPGAAEFDQEQPFPVFRYPRYPMIPTPRVVELSARLVTELECDTVWFGAAAPLGWLAPRLRRVGVQRFVAQTHGHEVGWAMLPGARQLLRHIARHVDVVTYLGKYTRRRLAPVMGRHAELVQLPPGVDIARYQPAIDGTAVRVRYGLASRPTVVCVSRLVPRKGQDTLIRALPLVKRSVPDAALLLVGGGRYDKSLRSLVDSLGLDKDVFFTGALPWPALPEHYAAGDVFAMPCRTRRFGLDVEGLGVVYLEASAMGLPVIAGDSGGAPDTVRDGETGYVVPGSNLHVLAGRLITLLADEALRHRMGKAGRLWVEQKWRWDVLASRMSTLLNP